MDNILLKNILERVLAWPAEQQLQLVEFVMSIEARMAGRPYQASLAEREAIDAALAGETVSEEEINSAYDKLRRS